MNDTDNEFAGIPDMPDADTVRAEILRTSGPLSWRPFGNRDGSPVGPTPPRLNPSEYDPKLVDAVIEARMRAGPGEHGNTYQKAIKAHFDDLAKLENERDRLLAMVTEVRYDPATGEASPTRNAAEREQLTAMVAGVQAKINLKEGEPGKQALGEKLDQAVYEHRLALKRAYMLNEAKRRAAAADIEEEIERQAQLLRKDPKGPGAK